MGIWAKEWLVGRDGQDQEGKKTQKKCENKTHKKTPLGEITQMVISPRGPPTLLF